MNQTSQGPEPPPSETKYERRERELQRLAAERRARDAAARGQRGALPRVNPPRPVTRGRGRR